MKFLKFIKNIFLLFLLKLMKTHISVDYKDNITCVIYAKKLFGKTYITKQLLYENNKLVGQYVGNLIDLINDVY